MINCRPNYDLNNLDFYYRFENCKGGEIKIEKKLSPSIFTGWTTFFNNGENVQDKLKSISDDIECSDLLNMYVTTQLIIIKHFFNIINNLEMT